MQEQSLQFRRRRTYLATFSELDPITNETTHYVLELQAQDREDAMAIFEERVNIPIKKLFDLGIA
jgi:hypothetical protein